MSVVVWCEACREPAQVDPSALGLTVECPWCQATFVAVEEAAVAVVAAPERPERPAPPPRPRRRRRAERPSGETAANTPDADHDPHRHPQGQLPASVLIGLALLPLAIPILWLVASAATGEKPLVSVAVPISLAVATSVLCLAVIYTIDWTPITRIKGVLILVLLAYFTAGSLYFLKQEVVERLQDFFSVSSQWIDFTPPRPRSVTTG